MTDTDRYVTVAPKTVVNIYNEPDVEDDYAWHIVGDLRAPGSGMSDDANYEVRDALHPMENIRFDPETSCFYATATCESAADRLVDAIKEQMVARGRIAAAADPHHGRGHKAQCNNPDPHEPHTWSEIIDPSVGRNHPSGWQWARCTGVQPHQRGWWNMVCFNGLSPEQQKRLVNIGNLEMGYVPTGDCRNPAEVEVTTYRDAFPGPRFYCRKCAIQYLTDLEWSE